MSNRAIVIAVVLALGLVGLVWYMNWRSGPSAASGAPATQEALAINAAEVVGLKVKSGPIEDEVRREASANGSGGGGWVFVKSSGAETLVWPIDPTPAQNLIRTIADLKPDPAHDRSGKMPDNAVLVTLVMKDGSSRFVRLSPTPVAGKTVVDIDGKTPFLADASILTAATQPGPRQWRINRAMPGSPSDLTRLTLVSKDEQLAFAKAENRWTMSRPINARTSNQAMGNLLDGIGKISIEKFVDDSPRGDPSAMGFASPRMIINTERDIRSVDESGQVQSSVARRDLFIGGPADAAGTQLFASPDAQGSQVFLVNASSITALSTAARSYLDLTASGASAGDVGVVTVKKGKQETGYRRVSGKWYKLLAGGKTDKAEADAKSIAEAVEFFTTRPGQPDPAPGSTQGVTATAPGAKGGADAGMKKLADVRLLADDGVLLDAFSVGLNGDGVLAVQCKDVIVSYPNTPAPKLLGLPLPKGVAAPAPSPTPAPAPAPAVKKKAPTKKSGK